MEMQILTVTVLSVCLGLAFGTVLGEDEDEAMLHSSRTQGAGNPASVLPSGNVKGIQYPSVPRQVELKLEFQPHKPQLLRSSTVDAERFLKQTNNAKSLPLVGDKQFHPMPEQDLAEENYDDDENEDDAADDSPDNENCDEKDDDEDKLFAERVTNLLSVLCENTKLMSDDVKALGANLGPTKGIIFRQKPKKPSTMMIHQDDYSEIDSDVDAAKRVDSAQLAQPKTEELSSSKDNEKDKEQKKKLTNDQTILDNNKQDQQHNSKKQLESIRAVRPRAYEYMELPFMVPPGRIIVPPLLQLLGRPSVLPWTLQAPNLMSSRRYLHALNELRLARAVQAASALRIKKQNKLKPEDPLGQHVEVFKENLRRLVSNRAAIERRVSSLLSSISHDGVFE